MREFFVNGSAFKIIQIIIYILVTVAFGYISYLLFSLGFIDYLYDEYKKGYVYEVQINDSDLNEDNLQYYLKFEKDTLKLFCSKDDSGDVEIGTLKFNDKSRRYFVFTTADEQTLTVEYDSIDCYTFYLIIHSVSVFIISITVYFALITILHCLVTYYGRNSFNANKCGIILNVIALPVGLLGVFGCYMASSYLKSKPEVYLWQ